MIYDEEDLMDMVSNDTDEEFKTKIEVEEESKTKERVDLFAKFKEA